jgi:DNA polymerase-3 subunit beta
VKVSCLQENLAKGLAIVGRAVATRSPLPVLSNVLLATDQGRLKLSAMNQEIGIVHWIGCKVETEGEVTVLARLLGEFIGSLPNERVDLRLDKDDLTLHLNCGRYQANVKGIAAEEFPPIPLGEGDPTLVLDAALLRESIEQVAMAAASDDPRQYLQGVAVIIEPEKVVLVASDGFRMAVRTLAVESGVSEKTEFIVPARSLTELSRVLSDSEHPVEIRLTQNRNQVIFSTGDVHLVSRLIEGTFPNYTQMIPPNHQTEINVSTLDLMQSTRMASYFARDGANVIKLEVAPEDESDRTAARGTLTITATATELGDNRSDLEAQVKGEETLIAFNARYLLDCINAINSPDVRIELSGSTSPGVIRPTDDTDYVHVIMPMHTVR